jgi:hypothetical protein
MIEKTESVCRLTCMSLLALALLFDPAAEATPTVAVVTAPGTTQSVTLTWSPSTSRGIMNYNLYCGVASGNYTDEMAVGETNNVTVSELVPGTTYYFAVEAEDTNGVDSPFSNEIKYSVPIGTNSVMEPQPCSVTIGNLNQTYSGQSEMVVVATNPTNVPVNITYNGIPSAPTNAGTYTVIATVASTNYVGAATNTFTISRAPAVISLGNLLQTYDGAGEAVSVTTQPANLPTSVTYNGLSSLPTSPGSYVVACSIVNGNYTGSTTNTLLINKAPQTITAQPWAADSISLDQFTNPIPLAATASSGLPVTFAIGPDSPATLTNGNMVVSLGVTGRITVLASQAGNTYYAAAPETMLSLEVTNGNQTITFNPIANQIVTNAPFQLTAAASSGLPVQFTVVSGPATINSNVLTLTGPGQVAVEATQVGNTNWNPAAPVSQSINVSLAGQTISFGGLAPQVYGNAPFSLNATASSGLPVTYSSSAPSVAQISGGTVTIMEAGTAIITASQAGDGINYSAAQGVSQTLTVDREWQTITVQPLETNLITLDQFTNMIPLTATASSGLPVAFALEAGSPATLTNGNALASLGVTGTITVLASQAGNVDYSMAPEAVLTLEVTNGNQTVAFNPIANQIVTNAPFQLTATASSGLPVQFSVVSGPATINGNVLTLTGPGLVAVEATQAGNTNWNPAAPVNQSFNVGLALASAAAPIITTQPDNQTAVAGGEATFSVSAGGALPLNYQWICDGTNISGATNASLTLTGVLFCQVGTYSVLVSNSLGSILSSNAELGTPPAITVQPASQSVESNCSATFNVLASSTAPLAYQWWNNGLALDTETNSSLALTNVQASNFGSYSVVVANAFGAITSKVAMLALAAPPVANFGTVLRFPEGGLRINASELTTNDTVAMFDSLTVIEVSSNSAAGGSVSLSGPWIYYAPPAGMVVSDTFTYTVSDGHCGTAVGTVTVQPDSRIPQPSHFNIAKMGDGSLQLSFDGMPGGTYHLQYTESLSPASWQPLTSQTADGFGVFQYTDSPVTGAQGRFYRAVWP